MIFQGVSELGEYNIFQGGSNFFQGGGGGGVQLLIPIENLEILCFSMGCLDPLPPLTLNPHLV